MYILRRAHEMAGGRESTTDGRKKSAIPRVEYVGPTLLRSFSLQTKWEYLATYETYRRRTALRSLNNLLYISEEVGRITDVAIQNWRRGAPHRRQSS